MGSFVPKIATGMEGNEIQSGTPNSNHTCNRCSLEIGRKGVNWWSQSRMVTGSISQHELRIRANDEPECWQDDLARCQGRHGIVPQESIFFHRGDGLQESSFFRFYCGRKKTTDTFGLVLWTKHPGDRRASTAYEPGGRPFLDILIAALMLIILSRNAIGWIVGRPKNNS